MADDVQPADDLPVGDDPQPVGDDPQPVGDIPHSRAELRKTLLNHVTAARPLRSADGAGWMTPETNVVGMSHHALASVQNAFKSGHWQALDVYMAASMGGDREAYEAGVVQAHDAVGRFLKASYEYDTEDFTVYAALTTAGWGEVPLPPKIAYLAQFGLYMMTRTWVGIRQVLELPGGKNQRSFEEISQAAARVAQKFDDDGVSDIERLLAAVREVARLQQDTETSVETVLKWVQDACQPSSK